MIIFYYLTYHEHKHISMHQSGNYFNHHSDVVHHHLCFTPIKSNNNLAHRFPADINSRMIKKLFTLKKCGSATDD